MILIVGGAYQGKLDYAKNAFGVTKDEVYRCESAEIDFSKRCIIRTDEFVFRCLREGVDALQYLADHRQDWEDCIFICRDIFCGIVPLGAETRQWRQNTGKVCHYLAQEASQVVRVFCGLGQQLK